VSSSDLYKSAMLLQPGGPDRTVCYDIGDYSLFIVFFRLAVMDPSIRGDQPFTYEDDKRQLYLVCNGEIFNFRKLCDKYDIVLHSGCDCEMLLHLYRLIGLDAMIKELRGEFAFTICEIIKETGEVKLFTGRDCCGKRELYITGDDTEVVICSEMKASPFLKASKEYYVRQVKPRHYLEISNLDEQLCNESTLKYTQWLDFSKIPVTIYDPDEAKQKLVDCLIDCVQIRETSDIETVFLVSGGLDSSLVCAIGNEHYKRHGKKVRMFSAGLESGSTDHKYAKITTQHFGDNVIYTHVIFTEQEAVDSLYKVIYHVETYDITTTRAAIIQFLLVRWIRKHIGRCVILVGEGPDELLSGYIYFLNAPNEFEMHLKNVESINDTHLFDAKRTGKTTSAHGCEVRIPYLDEEFIKLVFSIDPKLRMPQNGITKWLLRDAFSETGLLPDEVLWRKKEALSDGCSGKDRSWFQILREYIDTQVSDEEYETHKNDYSYLPPISKDAYYFRKVFCEHFGNSTETAKVLPYFWLPSWVGDGVNEPSARVLDAYS
jgi:asparagine synthase (glutamine-hydrolysing)